MTQARVVCAIRGHRHQLLGWWYLRQQLRQHRAIARTIVGHFYCPDFQRLRIYAQMQFAPLAAVVSAMLFHLSLAFTHHLDAGAIDQEM